MIIIKLQGGLGNQLFLYSLYKNLKHLGRDVKMDIESGFEGDELRNPCLEGIGLEYVIATRDEITDIRDSYMDIFSRIRRKIFGRRTFDYYEPEDGNFDPKVLKMTMAYLNGYFQSEKYFGDEASVKALKDELTKDKEDILTSSDLVTKIYNNIKNSESVSLHIRRGDYLAPGIAETYGGICTDEYYDKAIAMIREKFPDAKLFVFSNDLEWCKEKLSGDINVEFVSTLGISGTSEEIIELEKNDKCISDYRDSAELYLMSACKHHILANSSFSWWGAWLSDHEGMTIAPSRWLNNKNMTDIYTKDMTLI